MQQDGSILMRLFVCEEIQAARERYMPALPFASLRAIKSGEPIRMTLDEPLFDRARRA